MTSTRLEVAQYHLLVVLSGIVPTFVWRAQAEETLLIRAFGQRYELYRQRTRMIIPHFL